MQHDQAFRKLQDLILTELQHKQLPATQGAVEDFLRLASSKGYYIDDLIRMAESGMSGQQIADAVVSTYP